MTEATNAAFQSSGPLDIATTFALMNIDLQSDKPLVPTDEEIIKMFFMTTTTATMKQETSNSNYDIVEDDVT